MFKIKSVRFNGHPILGNLFLDFCDKAGRPVDTVILAGENGTGKSTVLEVLYSLMTRENLVSAGKSIEVDLDEDGYTKHLEYRVEETGNSLGLFLYDTDKIRRLAYSPEVASRYPTSAIFSDVDINFTASPSSSVTSMALDQEKGSRRSTSNLASQVNQLIVDVQALDDADIAHAARANPDSPARDLICDTRMKRFETAFGRVFDDIEYDRVDTRNGRKIVVFKKKGKDVPLDNFSSGEKQIVYRGCFLLKDANALEGAFVFIDEPEISLHPSWQKRILNYYRSIFTRSDGMQTSQLFVATHSPFIIHSDYRRDDKVVVLHRNDRGEIEVCDNPKYYNCNSVEAIKDAFSTESLIADSPTVYVEGRTDEIYLRRAKEVFDISTPFDIKWIGYLDSNGQERSTGSGALHNAAEFSIAHQPVGKRVFLFDCDTRHDQKEDGNVLVFTLPKFESSRKIKKGIENSLILDIVDITDFYSIKETVGDYGEKKTIEELKKMELCEYVCGLNQETLVHVFSNLRPMLEEISQFFTSRNV